MKPTSELFPGITIGDLAPPLHLSQREFNELLITHGSGAEYRRAIACPCVHIDSRQPATGCPACNGVGLFYPERFREPIIVLDTSRSSTAKWTSAGMIADGTITLTFPCGIIPGRGDLILPADEVHVVTETLYRNATMRVTDGLLRPERSAPGQRKRPLRPRNERLIYPGDVCIEAVYYVAADRQVVEATPTLDFTLGPRNEWRWNDGRGPADGSGWTVRYRAPAAYMVGGSGPLFRQENNADVPYRVTASRLDRIDVDDLR